MVPGSSGASCVSRLLSNCVMDELPRSLLNRPPRPLAGPPVCIDHNVDRVRRRSVVILQDLTYRLGNRAPSDNTLQKSGDRDLVRGVEPCRGGSAHSSGLIGEAETGEAVEVGRLELQAPRLGPVESAEGDAAALRVREGVAD